MYHKKWVFCVNKLKGLIRVTSNHAHPNILHIFHPLPVKAIHFICWPCTLLYLSPKIPGDERWGHVHLCCSCQAETVYSPIYSLHLSIIEFLVQTICPIIEKFVAVGSTWDVTPQPPLTHASKKWRENFGLLSFGHKKKRLKCFTGLNACHGNGASFISLIRILWWVDEGWQGHLSSLLFLSHRFRNAIIDERREYTV